VLTVAVFLEVIMENDVFAIWYNRELLIVIRNLPKNPSPLPGSIIEWYAKEYGFDRRSLSGAWSHTLDGQECPIFLAK
jgi:hypothetical protein